jgi:quercetin dioxygenase-like cupin family protein
MVMNFANLMRAKLESADDLEVVVSRVEVPPHTRLPVHFHPGEEFAYVIEGAFVLWQEGEGECRYAAGETGKVPLRKVHTVYTEEEGATILAFRVHKIGEPERILVE